MDRTLVDTHTAKLYIRYQRDIGEMGIVEALRASFWVLQYTVGMINAERVARHALRSYRGQSTQWLEERCRQWFKDYVLREVSNIGRTRVREYQQRGTPVAVATSAVRFTAQPLADELNIEHMVCSELEQVDGILTGEFEAPLCYGEGKLQKARQLTESLGCDLKEAAFFTDSITDLPLMEQVSCPVAVNPDARLRKEARRRGWRIEEWL